MKTVLCFGDSNTHGFDPVTGGRYDRDVRWTGRLQKLLGADYYVVEEGCNGRTTHYDDPEDPWKNGLPYLTPCLSTHKPLDYVIIMLGTNDLKTYYHASAKDIADGAKKLVETTIAYFNHKQMAIPKIILVSPIEVGPDILNSGHNSFELDAIDRSKEFPRLYEAVAKELGCIFFNAALCCRASEVDSLHLMPEEHEKLADALCKVILEN